MTSCQKCRRPVPEVPPMLPATWHRAASWRAKNRRRMTMLRIVEAYRAHGSGHCTEAPSA